MGKTAKTAHSLIDADHKVYITSDNSRYVVKRSSDLSELKKHCSHNNLTLFDVEVNQEVKIKASKKHGSAES